MILHFSFTQKILFDKKCFFFFFFGGYFQHFLKNSLICAEGTRRSSRSTTITTTKRSSSRKDAGYTLTLGEVQVSSSRENGFGLSTWPRIYGASKQDDKRGGGSTMPVKRRHNDWLRVVRFKISLSSPYKSFKFSCLLVKVAATINTL